MNSLQRLTQLKINNPRDYLEYCRYCREILGLDPNKAPYWYIDNWLKLPPKMKELGY